MRKRNEFGEVCSTVSNNLADNLVNKTSSANRDSHNHCTLRDQRETAELRKFLVEGYEGRDRVNNSVHLQD